MKAVVNRRYGGPEVFEVAEVSNPVPKDDEILVRVRAAVAGPADSAFRQGKPFLVRLLYGLRRPKFPIGGAEFAGEVVGVGSAATRFRVGDEVFGLSPDSFGAWAEYVSVPEAKSVVRKPPSLSMEDAVAIVDGGATARTFLKETARLQPGQRVLVNGAAGAVGSYGVQIVKFLGAHVTGVCGTANVDYVRSLGADEVIDYTKEDFTTSGRYDVVFDAVGKRSFPECRRVLAPQGLYLTTVPTLSLLVHLVGNLFREQKAGFATAGLMQNPETLAELAQWAEAGHVWANVHQRFPMERMADAHRVVDGGHKRGNVVLTWGATKDTPRSAVP